MIILALATAASAWILRHVVNDVLSGQDISKIWALGVSIAAIYIVKGFAGFGQNIVLDRIGNAVQTGFYIRSIEQLAAPLVARELHERPVGLHYAPPLEHQH